jgi:antitoxin component YwqK of YwqJK toxin-antitoxin module
MKQILIEKYIEPSEIEVDGNWIFETWVDRNYDKHSFMGQPAGIYYYCGEIMEQHWKKKGILHRDRDLPAVLYYLNTEAQRKDWYKKGKLHREGEKPAVVRYNNGKIISQEWFKNGELIK